MGLLVGLTQEQLSLLNMTTFRLAMTDPSDIHERRKAAMELVEHEIDMAGDGEWPTPGFLAAAAVEQELTREFYDIENGYRERVGLPPNPYPWED